MISILAVDANMGIGVGERLAFFNKEDMNWFKSKTLGQTCIAGYNTYQTVKNLKGRNVLLLTNELYEAIWNDSGFYEDYVIVGGAKTYKQLAHYTKKCYITFYKEANPDCDAFVDVYKVYKHLKNRKVISENADFIIEEWS